MEADQFCLKWNNFHSSILSAFESLQNSEDLVDVTLMCEGQNVKAHKVILSACSPYFRNLFKEIPCQHPVIIMKDVLHCDLVAILQFMYQGEVLITQENLSSFLKTAELLQVSGLAGNRPESKNSKQEESPIVADEQIKRNNSPVIVPHSPSPSPSPTSVPAPASVPVTVSTPAPPPPALIPTLVQKPQTDRRVTREKVKSSITIKDDSLHFDSASLEPIEPMQSCSYQSNNFIVKQEVDESPFEDMDYNMTTAENIMNASEPALEEQSILERSLKAQGLSPHSGKLLGLGPNHKAKRVKQSGDLISASGAAAVVAVTTVPPGVQCPHCPKAYSNQSALKYHVRLIHSDMTNMFCCHLCPEAFEYREAYKSHMWEKHNVRN